MQHPILVEGVDAHAASTESERLLQALRTTSDFVVVFDVAGKPVHANEAVRLRLGLGDILSLEVDSFWALISTESGERLSEGMWQSLLDAGTWHGEVTARAADGSQFPILLSARVHHDADCRPAYVSAIGRDISDRKALERRLVESEARFRSLVQHASDIVSVNDAEGRFRYLSPAVTRVLGYEPDELIGTRAELLVHPDDLDSIVEQFAQHRQNPARPVPSQYRVRHRTGTWRYVEAVSTNLLDDPVVQGFVVNARDVTERRRAELLVADQARILERLARGAPLTETLTAVAGLIEQWADRTVAVVCAFEGRNSVLRVEAAPHLPRTCAQAIEGLPVPSDYLPVQLSDERLLVSLDLEAASVFPGVRRALLEHGFRGLWAVSIRNPGAGALGALLVLRLDVEPLGADDRQLLQLASDLAAVCIERDRSEAQLAHQALHDSLTGLPNRAVALARIERLTHSPASHGQAAILFLDLDRFKVLNDSLGHDTGDRLLRELGARLRAGMPRDDLIARFGGDEFVIVCEDVGGVVGAYKAAERILGVVERPFDLDGTEVVVTASIGIAMVEAREPDALLRDADAAMYRAKERGRAHIELFTEKLRADAVARLEIERDLRQAIERDELTVHYQPVVSLADGRFVGLEALLRWRHPEQGTIGPDRFLSVAEETGLVREIGACVLEQACFEAKRWDEQHPERAPLVVAVNLSPRQLADRALIPTVTDVLRRTGIAPARVAFEITERPLIEEAGVARRALEELRGLGAYLVLDDFGTGYSSLAHLKRFPIHAIKIDEAFVSGLVGDPGDAAIVAAVVGLAKSLGLTVVAEGVETAEQAARLRVLGCQLAQGNWWSVPVPAEQVDSLLRGPAAAPLLHDGPAK